MNYGQPQRSRPLKKQVRAASMNGYVHFGNYNGFCGQQLQYSVPIDDPFGLQMRLCPECVKGLHNEP